MTKPYEIPDAKRLGQLRDYLVSNGFSNERALSMIGLAPRQRPMGVIADELRVHLKQLPRVGSIDSQ